MFSFFGTTKNIVSNRKTIKNRVTDKNARIFGFLSVYFRSEHICTCEHGVAADLATCASDGTEQCQSCTEEGYKLDVKNHCVYILKMPKPTKKMNLSMFRIF